MFNRFQRSRCSIHGELNLSSMSCTPTPSDIIIPELFLTDHQGLLSTSFIECTVASLRTQRESFEMR